MYRIMRFIIGFVLGVHIGQTYTKEQLQRMGNFVYRDVSRRISDYFDDENEKKK